MFERGDVVVSTINPEGPKYIVMDVEPPKPGLKEDERALMCVRHNYPSKLYTRWPAGYVKLAEKAEP